METALNRDQGIRDQKAWAMSRIRLHAVQFLLELQERKDRDSVKGLEGKSVGN